MESGQTAGFTVNLANLIKCPAVDAFVFRKNNLAADGFNRLAEGIFDFGGGEKDIILALPWFIWSVWSAACLAGICL